MPPATPEAPVLIVGGGLAGLCCALHLERRGHAVRLFEASDRPGGRVRTDVVEGFALDRGFQVLLDGYPEARATLDLPALELGRFVPGAMIWTGTRMVRLVDPLRRPRDVLATVGAGLATAGDVARLAAWGVRSLRAGPHGWTASDDEPDAEAALRARGFSRPLIESFWRPFLGGVLLDRELRASRRSLEFLFRSFMTARAALPSGGMGAIPDQLAARLRPGTITAGARVVDASGEGVRLDDGTAVRGAAVVVATDPGVAARLLPDLAPPPMREVGCLYLATAASDAPPVANHLVLDGTGEGVVNNLCLPSEVASGYAPDGHTLVSATILSHALDASDDAIEKRARDQLRTWFGPSVDRWRTLRMQRVSEALPAQTPGPFAARERSPRVSDGLFVAGDHRDVASIQGAMASGRRAAAAVAETLAQGTRAAR